MRFVASHNSVEKDFEFLIETLKIASLTRNYAVFEEFLKPYLDTDLTHHSIREQAYLNYYLGYYYVHSGKSQNNTTQEQGRNYLTNALDLFGKLGLENESIETEISLGWSFFETGDIGNYEAYLLDALSRCSRPDSEAYLSGSVSLLIYYFEESKIAEALAIIEDIKSDIDNCSNQRIRWQYYHNSARIFRRAKQYQTSYNYFQKAITLAQDISNQLFEALSLNSLACCYQDATSYDLAFDCVDESIKILKSLKNEGFLAEVLDTKAMILFDVGKVEEAETTINAALTYFRLGESNLVLVNSLWNKIKILFELKKKAEIFETFRELSNKVFPLSETKQKEFYRKFAELTLILFGETYDEKKLDFQEAVILPVLHNSETLIEAAQKLGFSSHQNLSNLIARHPKLKTKKKSSKVRKDKHEIKRIIYQKHFSIPLYLNLNSVGFFQCSQRIALYHFGIENEMVIIVQKTKQGFVGDKFLLFEEKLFFGEIADGVDTFCFITERGDTVRPDVQILGRIIGYAELSESKTVFSLI